MIQVPTKIKIAVTGLGGAGTGIVAGTLAGEVTSRATRQVSWNACAVKAAVKGTIGLVVFGVSGRVGNAVASFFLETMAYGAWGSILVDIATAWYPGGLVGLAEDWASTLRVYSAGGKAVVRELKNLENVRERAPAESPSIL